MNLKIVIPLDSVIPLMRVHPRIKGKHNMGERFIVKVRTNGQKHGFGQADIHFNFGITPRPLCNLGWLI